jgi:hypothetical protein
MSTFIEWYSDPEIAEERREIMRILPLCSESDAVVIQMLGDLASAIDTLGSELGAQEVESLPDEEEEA